MSDNDIVIRLRDWKTIYPEDDEDEWGALYLKAADAIEQERAEKEALQARVNRLEKALKYRRKQARDQMDIAVTEAGFREEAEARVDELVKERQELMVEAAHIGGYVTRLELLHKAAEERVDELNRYFKCYKEGFSFEQAKEIITAINKETKT